MYSGTQMNGCKMFVRLESSRRPIKLKANKRANAFPRNFFFLFKVNDVAAFTRNEVFILLHPRINFVHNFSMCKVAEVRDDEMPWARNLQDRHPQHTTESVEKQTSMGEKVPIKIRQKKEKNKF